MAFTWPFGLFREPLPAPTSRVSRVLLASEGRPFTPDAIDAALDLVAVGGTVSIIAIARIWGSSLGFPNPGLMPNKQELAEQHGLVDQALLACERRGVQASGRVVGTRDAAKRIVKEAVAINAGAVVMAADAEPHWLVASLLWTNEPWRVRKLSPVGVELVISRPEKAGRET